jgi:hypothetical protein
MDHRNQTNMVTADVENVEFPYPIDAIEEAF